MCVQEKLAATQARYEKRLERGKSEASAIDDQLKRMEAEKNGLLEQLDEKNGIISNCTDAELDLNWKIQSLEKELHSVCGDFLFNCRDLKKVHMIVWHWFQFIQCSSYDTAISHWIQV